MRRTTWVALATNLLLFTFKLTAGIVGRSQAVVADAVHTLADSLTDIAILVGVAFWAAPADRSHPHGHGRIETIVTAAIGVMLAAVGVGLGYNAITTIREDHTEGPGLVAFIAALASIICKEILYRWTVRRGKRLDSPAIIASAWHHRSDALSSIPAVIAVGTAAIVPEWTFVDHVGAIVVSFFILHVAWKILRRPLREVLDWGASPEEIKQIRRIARGTKGVRSVHKIRTRYVGSRLEVDLHVQVDGKTTVRRGHDISGEVKQRILADGPSVLDVVVHLEPYEGRGPP